MNHPSRHGNLSGIIMLLLVCVGCSGDDDLVSPTPVGTLLVESLPYGIEAAWTVTGPGGYVKQGEAHATLSGLAAGDYIVTWQDVAGWYTPAVVTRSVALGDVETVGGTFTSREWTALDSGVDTDLLDVEFLDADLGWAVGKGGVILHTVDGGTIWTRQTSGTTEDLNGVSFCDETNGYAVGNDSIILRTFDGGIQWWSQEIVIPYDWWGYPLVDAPSDFIDVILINPSVATVVGFAGGTYRTINGGNDWFRQTTVTRLDLYGVDYTDVVTGTIVGENGIVLTTGDGGAIWKRRSGGTDENLVGVSLSDGDTGTAVGMNGTILRTTDRGVTWTSQTSGCSAFLYDVSFVDANFGTVVGNGGVVLHTTDGGANWTRQAGGTFRFLLGVQFLDRDFGTMVGLDGMMFRSVNAPAPPAGASP